MTARRKRLLLVVPLAMLITLAVIFPRAVLSGLIEPLATVLWATWRVVISVDQGVYWGAVVILCAVLMIQLFPRDPEHKAHPTYSGTKEPRTQVERWQDLMQQAPRGKDQAEALREGLKNLLAGSMSGHEPIAAADLERELAARGVTLPAAVQHYLFAAPAARGPRWLQRLTAAQALPEQNAIHELLHWMESSMEMRDDE